MNYGYEGQVLLPVSLKVPASAKPGTSVTLKAEVTFLVCADICVPEDAKLKLDRAGGGGHAADGSQVGRGDRQDAHGRAQGRRPEPPSPGPARAPNRVLKLAVTGAALKGADLSRAYFFPYDAKAIDQPPSSRSSGARTA